MKALLRLIIENYMPNMSSSEFKVYIVIYHLTLGAKVQMASITLNQIIISTGLTKNTVIKAITTLEDQEYIYQLKGYYPFKYMLNYSTIYTGDGSKFEPNAIIIDNITMSNTPITTGFPESW
ncbi:MAG: hypothetical protein ABJK35_06445 [Balneola sp.]